MENTMTLKEFGKSLGKDEIVEAPKGPSLSELTTPINGDIKSEETKVDTPPVLVTPERKVEVFDISDAKAMALSMQKTAQERATERGIIPNLDAEEVEKMEKALDVGLNDYLAYTEKDRNEAVEVLRRHGYTDEEIDDIPYIKLLDIARAVKADEQDGTVGVMRLAVQADGTIKEDSLNDIKDNKIDDTQIVDSAVKTEVKPVEQPTTAGTTTEQKAPTIIDKNDEEIKEPSLAEVIGDKEIYIKYSEKPLNSYKRAKENKVKKLL